MRILPWTKALVHFWFEVENAMSKAVASKRIASKISRVSRLFGVALAAAAKTQAPVVPHFEVESIKPAPPDLMSQYAAGKLPSGMSVDGARVDIGVDALADLL